MLRALALAATIFLPPPAAAVEVGEDGLHKPGWLRETFKDLRDDLAEANTLDKRLLIILEQRGCIYCTEMHERVLADPDIEALIKRHYFVVQVNLFGDLEVTDFDGTSMAEKAMAARWGLAFTPTLVFLPEAVPDGVSAADAAVAILPGSMDAATTEALLIWVHDRSYETGQTLQDSIAERMAAGG